MTEQEFDADVPMLQAFGGSDGTPAAIYHGIVDSLLICFAHWCLHEAPHLHVIPSSADLNLAYIHDTSVDVHYAHLVRCKTIATGATADYHNTLCLTHSSAASTRTDLQLGLVIKQPTMLQMQEHAQLWLRLWCMEQGNSKRRPEHRRPSALKQIYCLPNAPA